MQTYMNDYLVVSRDQRTQLLNKCRRTLKEFEDFDTIAFSGNSGALMSFPLAHRLNKEIIIIRKPRETDSSHSYVTIEGIVPCHRKIVIIDDFVSIGRTIRYIVDTIKKEDKDRNSGVLTCKFVGILLYNQQLSSKSDYIKNLNIPTVNFKLPGTPS